jgi:hypothetical protein
MPNVEAEEEENYKDVKQVKRFVKKEEQPKKERPLSLWGVTSVSDVEDVLMGLE